MAQAETRRLAAIMFTDMVGFSRQMGANEARTLRLLEMHDHIIQQAVAEHQGHVIKTAGDGFLVEFPSVVHTVQCAQDIQAQFRAYNADKEKPEQIHLRIGIHLGDIVVQPNGDVLGDTVLSVTHGVEWLFGWSRDPQVLERGLELAQKAVALDDSLPVAHSLLGRVYQMKKQHDKAIAGVERAITLNPNYAEGYAGLADSLSLAGRPEEAIGLAEKAMRLNPRYPPMYLNSLGFAYLSAERYEEAIAFLKQALSRNPNLPAPRVTSCCLQ